MSKLLMIVLLLGVLTSKSAMADAVDGKNFCRPIVSEGQFGQPKGARLVCISFNNGFATDNGYTLGGNPPLSFPYALEGSAVTFNRTTYMLELDELRTVSGNSAGIVYLLQPQTINDVHTPASWVFGEVSPNSLAKKEQLRFLQHVVVNEIRTKRDDQKSISIINANLASMNLPVIGLDADIEIVHGNGFVGSTEGAAIKDAHHRFCLPCSSSGNHYEFGITELKN